MYAPLSDLEIPLLLRMNPTAHRSKGCQRHSHFLIAQFRVPHNSGKLPRLIFGLGMLAIRLGLGIRICKRS